jgi:hypothetical protein
MITTMHVENDSKKVNRPLRCHLTHFFRDTIVATRRSPCALKTVELRHAMDDPANARDYDASGGATGRRRPDIVGLHDRSNQISELANDTRAARFRCTAFLFRRLRDASTYGVLP